MKFLLLFCLLMLSSCATNTNTKSNANVRSYVYQIHSIVHENNITYLVGSSSVVVIAPRYGITTLHSMKYDDQRTQWIVLSDSVAQHVKIVSQDIDNDLALITGDFGCPCAPIDTTLPVIDTNVDVVGYPLGSVLKTQIVTHGNIQGIDTTGKYITTSNVAVGMSGGGIFINQKLIGIVIGFTGTPDGKDLNWISYGAPLSAVQNLYKQIK